LVAALADLKFGGFERWCSGVEGIEKWRL